MAAFLASFSILFFTIFIGFVPIVYSRSEILSVKFNAIEIVVISIIIALLYLAVLSILLLNIQLNIRRYISVVGILIPFLLGIFSLVRRPRILQDLYGGFNCFLVGSVVVYIFVILLLLLSSFKIPGDLPDGPFVDKTHNTSVKIQVITGSLPADNVIPYVVQEYLARGILLKRNSPILPGQQITNRPILVSLISLPIRLMLFDVVPRSDLPEFEYAGIKWPDYRVLTSDDNLFRSFLGVSIFLNILIVFSVGLFIKKSKLSIKLSILTILLIFSSPYFLFQTIFTWPKMFAGFFILTGIYSYFYYKNYYIFGFLIGLAYLSHPYSLAYLLSGSLIIIYCGRHFDWRVIFKYNFKYLFAFFGIVLPWILWAKYLNLPSDLVNQNSSFNRIDYFQNVWSRISNLSTTFYPWHLIDNNFLINNFIIRSNLNIVGSVGFFVFFSLFISIIYRNNNRIISASNEDKFTLIYLSLSSFFLICVFSNPALPILHGLQPLIVFVMYYAVIHSKSKLNLTLISSQILLNILFLVIYFFFNATTPFFTE